MPSARVRILERAEEETGRVLSYGRSGIRVMSVVDGALTGELTSEAAEPSPALDWGRHLQEHEGWLRKVILVRTGEPQAVDEVFQQVSLAAVEQRWPLSDPAKAGPWLHRLAVIKSARYRRQQGRHRRALSALASHAPSPSGDALPDLMAWLVREERRQLARQALARLPARDAEMLLLKYAERWSYRRIAEQLGITEKAVDARLARARRRLRQELAVLGISTNEP